MSSDSGAAEKLSGTQVLATSRARVPLSWPDSEKEPPLVVALDAEADVAGKTTARTATGTIALTAAVADVQIVVAASGRSSRSLGSAARGVLAVVRVVPIGSGAAVPDDAGAPPLVAGCCRLKRFRPVGDKVLGPVQVGIVRLASLVFNSVAAQQVNTPKDDDREHTAKDHVLYKQAPPSTSAHDDGERSGKAHRVRTS